ncbi:MAG TPA: hypothetical protein VMV10_25635 [Pirellulales bacterium]|nr:hypothetical protein [Pirellulales bacterium]
MASHASIPAKLSARRLRHVVSRFAPAIFRKPLAALGKDFLFIAFHQLAQTAILSRLFGRQFPRIDYAICPFQGHHHPDPK